MQVGKVEIGADIAIGELSRSTNGNDNSELEFRTMSINGKDSFLKVIIWNPNAMKNSSNLREYVVHGALQTPEKISKL